MPKHPLALSSQYSLPVRSDTVSPRSQGSQKSKKVTNGTGRNWTTQQSDAELAFNRPVFKRNDNDALRQKSFFESCRGYKTDSQSCLDGGKDSLCGIHINVRVELAT